MVDPLSSGAPPSPASLHAFGSFRYHIDRGSFPYTNLVFLHGLGDSRRSFGGLISCTRRLGCTNVYFDLPGFGENNCLEAGLGDIQTIILEVLGRECPAGQYVVIGHSLGGLIALLLRDSSWFRARKAQFFLIEGSLTTVDQDFLETVREPPAGIGYDGFLRSLKNDRGTAPESYVASAALSNPRTFRKLVAECVTMGASLRDALKEDSRVFTYVLGDGDKSDQRLRDLMLFKACRIVFICDSGHWVHHDQLYRCQDVLRELVQ